MQNIKVKIMQVPGTNITVQYSYVRFYLYYKRYQNYALNALFKRYVFFIKIWK